MIALQQNLDHNDQADRCKGDEEVPCIICGRPVRNWKLSIHVHNGGADAVTEAEAATLDEAADLGCWPIGANCLRQHPELKPYVQKDAFDAIDN